VNKQEIERLLNINVSNIGQVKRLLSENGGGNGDYDFVPPYPDREKIKSTPFYEELALHFMGLVGYVYRNLKTDTEKTITTVYDCVRGARKNGVRYVRSFLINGSRKPSEMYMADALPWPTVNGKIDLSKTNEYYWECVRIVEQACKYWHCIHRPTFFMDRYNEDIFHRDNNHQGVHGYRSKEALNFKKHFMKSYIYYQKNELGNRSNSTFEIENEPYHRNWVEGANIADDNLAMWRAVESLNLGSTIADVWTCSGTSEFSHANFVEPQTMIIGGKERTFGSEEFRSRKVKPEYHGVSTLASLKKLDWDRALRSGWKHVCNNEDGANDGSYNPIPWTNYRQANYEELLEMCEHAIRTSRAKNKRWYFTMFAMDCLTQDNGVAKETYDRINWHRYGAYKQARLKLD
jgi:hypothetical protein